jgi:DNA-directed RNA polymerase subunit RPC12/RpoP
MIDAGAPLNPSCAGGAQSLDCALLEKVDCGTTGPQGGASAPQNARRSKELIMSIRFSCEQCGQRLSVDDSMAGHKVQCPGCSFQQIVPAGEEQPPAPPPRVAPQPLRRAAAPPPPPRGPEPPAPPRGPAPQRSPAPPRGNVPPPRHGGPEPVGLGGFLNRAFSSSLNNYGLRLGFLWGVVLLAAYVLPLPIPEEGSSGPGMDMSWFQSGSSNRGGRGGGALQELQRQFEREMKKSPGMSSFFGGGNATAKKETHWRVAFLPLEMLWTKGMPAIAKFLAIYPLLAGIGMILLSRLTQGYPRALAMIGITLLLGIILLASADRELMAMVPFLSRAINSALFVILLLTGLFIGLRLQEGNPHSRFGRILAGSCGAIFLLMLILPLLPQPFSLLLLLPFQLMDFSVFVGLVTLFLLAGLGAVSVMACVTFGGDLMRNRMLAWMGIWIFLATLVFAPLLVVMGACQAEGEGIIETIFGSILGAVKFEPLCYGLIAPLVIGGVELSVLLASKRINWAGLLPTQLPPLEETPADADAEPVEPVETVEPEAAEPETPAPPPRKDAGAKDVRARLQQLNELKAEGLISDADYEAKKKALLDML